MRHLILPLVLALPAILSAADLKLGIVGTDTSHVIAFTKIFNDPKNPNHVPGAQVIIAYKGGSPDLPSSWDRVNKYADELRTEWDVEIMSEISYMCNRVDAILLESVDGRTHLKQAEEVFKCGKPVFIDKPLAANYADAKAIAALAKKHNVKWFSSSSLRWAGDAMKLKDTPFTGATVWGPGPTDPTHAEMDMSWYGIHPAEMLYALMGTGCVEVTRTVSGNDVVVGKWKDGRLGTIHLLRPYGDFFAAVTREKGNVETSGKVAVNYASMLKEVVTFFQTGKAPVSEEETLELFAFMAAAQESKAKGGIPIKLKP